MKTQTVIIIIAFAIYCYKSLPFRNSGIQNAPAFKDVASNKWNHMCGITSAPSDGVWCTSNYKTINPSWTQILIPTELTTIALDNGDHINVDGDTYLSTFDAMNPINPQTPVWTII
jgi:hypothetical protein